MLYLSVYVTLFSVVFAQTITGLYAFLWIYVQVSAIDDKWCIERQSGQLTGRTKWQAIYEFSIKLPVLLSSLSTKYQCLSGLNIFNCAMICQLLALLWRHWNAVLPACCWCDSLTVWHCYAGLSSYISVTTVTRCKLCSTKSSLLAAASSSVCCDVRPSVR